MAVEEVSAKVAAKDWEATAAVTAAMVAAKVVVAKVGVASAAEAVKVMAAVADTVREE